MTGVALAGLLVLGAGYTLVETAGLTLMQRLASDEVLSRVFGVVESTYVASTGIGAVLAPLLLALLGTRATLAVVGAALPVLAIARRRTLARFEAGHQIPARPFALLRGVPLFAPLPVASVENLALRMEPVPVTRGEAVVNQRVIAHLPDGTARTMLVSVLPQRSPDGTIAGVIGVGADVSHVSELERVLAQSNRLESIGQLAAGIAHEINTPVQFVSDNVRFLAESFDGILTLVRAVGALVDGPPADQESAPLVAVRTAVAEADLEFLVAEIPTALSESQEGLVRVAEIVRAMKDFSHPGSGRVDTDINRAVESTVQVSRNEWKYVAEVALDLDPAVGMAPCFEGELKQVILNMVVNAAHAIAERRAVSGTSVMGTITITTRRDGNSVTVGIGDDGSGMTPEIERRIFDPFFTTKEVGKGTGQGLSLAHDTIVRKHGGRIDVRSKLGVGTTFTLVLPAKLAVDAAAEGAEALV